MPRILLYDEPLPFEKQHHDVDAPLVVPMPAPKLLSKMPVDMVFGTAVLSPSRMLAVFYWARSQHFGQALILLDFEVAPVEADTWEKIRAELKQHSAQRRARMGRPLGLFLESETLVAQGQACGLTAHLIPAWLTTKDAWVAICQSAASILVSGNVGYTRDAMTRMDARPFLDASGVAAGPRSDDPTVPAFLYGVVIALDPALASNPKPGLPQKARVS